jgi:SLOG cluster4 family
MHIDLDAPVIAVFGSNSTEPAALKLAELKAASLLGAAINHAGAILLTGASPPPEGYLPLPGTVKDAAVHGAERAGAMTSAAWVGVARTSGPDAPQRRGLRSFVVTPGGKDRRNLVEALICDAAIAVGCATPGTASEALFSMFVGRRLVVLTDDPTGIDASPRALSSKARVKVKSQGDLPAVDAGITAAYAWADRTNERTEVRELVTDERDADTLVAHLLTPDPRHDPRPDLNDLVDQKTWNDFVREALRAAGRWPG